MEQKITEHIRTQTKVPETPRILDNMRNYETRKTKIEIKNRKSRKHDTVVGHLRTTRKDPKHQTWPEIR